MPESGKECLEKYGVPCAYDVLTKCVINRQVTDICPMEKNVAEFSKVEEVYEVLGIKFVEMRACSV